ncbi:hypothetical protein A2U01_0039510, partial [Trifolium medium]|nr:hypothetical protein [Trifolium medium]
SSSKDSRIEKLHDVDAGAPSGDVEIPTPGATIVEQSFSKGYSPSEDNHQENKEDSDSEGFHEGHSRMAPEPDFGLSDFQILLLPFLRVVKHRSAPLSLVMI